MQYLCLVYQDENRLKAMPRSEYESLVSETLSNNESLLASGHLVSANALELVEGAASLRLRDGGVVVTDGPFVETKEQIGGYFLIEARDLNEAIRIASKLPPARLGGIEIRPVKDLRTAEGS
ncbi:MAG TPA: YciI family protein [Thermomicrobiales bacterium]|nr:YciI family protein [Thermomicrobiales bacterium]